MSRSLSRLQAVLLGAVVLAGMGLGTFGLFTVGHRPWHGRDAIRVYAAFNDIGGVKVGDPVRIQGMDAGEVEAILPPDVPGQPVRLQLRLAGSMRHLVTADARAQVTLDGLLAGKMIRILPGSPGSLAIADGADLNTMAAVDWTEELAQLASKLNHVLTEADGLLKAVGRSKDSVAKIADEMTKATNHLHQLLAQANATLHKVQQGQGSLGKLLMDDRLYTELTRALGQVNVLLEDLHKTDGTLGKLVKNNEVYQEALHSLQDVRKMVSSVKQNADAIKSLPVVRSYIVDAHKELVRPDCRRWRRWFPEHHLFEPGRAVLTEQGRKQLDGVAGWLNDQKGSSQEVIIAAFAAPNLDGDVARTLTQKQSAAVCDYLKSQHSIHRTGRWWWSTRSVRPLGVGNNPPAVPETETLPPARIELLIFEPEG